MSELNERRWAVLSERGCEAAGLSYGEAAGLVERLRGERVRGLCVVTESAAARMPRPKEAPAKSPSGAGGKAGAGGAKPRRGRRKSAT